MWQVKSRWGYFSAIVGRLVHPIVAVFHSTCFNASVVEGSKQRWPRPGQPTPPLKLVKNIHNLAPVFVADSTRLIVNHQVRDLLRHFAKVEFQPAEIAIAWDCPYDAGSLAFLEDDAYDRERSLDLDWSSFVEKYRVDPPSVELYEVVTHGYRITNYEYRDDPGRYIDRKIYKFTGTLDGRSSVDCVVSKIMLEEVGLYRSDGFICVPELLSMLKPFLRPYFFWTGTFPF